MAEAIIIAAIVSAAISAASYTLSYLLTPKQKPVERGRLQGQIQVQDSSYGSMIPLVYGGAMPDGSAHGFKLAGNVIDLSEIRKVKTERTERTGSGKGARSTQVIDHNYDADIAIMFADNETELLALYADTDLIYDIRPSLFGPSGPGSYEAEAGTLTNASTFTDARFSSGQGVQLNPTTGAVQWSSVQGYGANTLFRLAYVSSGRRSIEIYVNGSLAHSGWVGGTGGSDPVPVAFTLDIPFSGSNTVKVVNTLPDVGALLFVDKIEVMQPAMSGGVSLAPEVPPNYTGGMPPATDETEYLNGGRGMFGYIPLPDVNGTATTALVAGNYSGMRFYSGTETQEPDPVIEARFQSLYATEYGLGFDVAPAYLGRSYVVLEHFNLSNYQRVPNFTAILRHKTIRTAQDILVDLAVRSKALPEDYDFSALADHYVRGMAVVNRSSLKEVAANTLQVRWGFDFAQRDGAVTAVLRGGAADYTVPASHLGFRARGGGDSQQQGEGAERVRVSVKLNEGDLPRAWEVTAYDPGNELEPVTKGWSRSLTGSAAARTTGLEMALSPDEVTEVARRLGETAWTEGRYAVDFSLPHQYLVAQPSSVLEVDNGLGTIITTRVVERTGNIPGSLDFKGVLVEQAQYYEPELPAPTWTPPDVLVPPTLVGQFVETGYLSPAEAAVGAPGYYVGVASYEQGPMRGCAVYRWKGGVRVRAADLDKLATVGVCVGALDATDTGTEYVDADIYGSSEPEEAFTDAELAAGFGGLMVGDERMQYKTATKIAGGVGNRWRFSDLRNRASDLTARSGHAAGERLIVLDDALKFVSVEAADAEVAIDHQFVAAGMNPDDVPTVPFTWSGMGSYARPSNLTLTRLNGTTGAPLTVSFDKGRRGSSLGNATKAEVYRVRILDVTSGDLIREHFLTSNYNEPVQFVSTFDPDLLLIIGADGTVESAGSSTQVGVAVSSQVLYDDMRLVFRLGATRPIARVELVGAKVACGRDLDTDEILALDHYFQNGDEVTFSGGSPLAGVYYVVGATSDRYQIATTVGGTAVSLAGVASSFYMHYPPPVSTPALCGFVAATDGSGDPVELRPLSTGNAGALAVADDLCVVELNNGVLTFYVGNLQIPYYTADVAAARFPCQVQVTVGQSSPVLDTFGAHAQGIYRATIQHTAARTFLYTSGMQTNDASAFTGGVVPATVTVEVCEMFDGEPGLTATATG